MDRVSETTRLDWARVFGMNIYEFFNILAYARDKSNYEAEQIKNWQKQH